MVTPLRRKSSERLPNALAATIGSDAAAAQTGKLCSTSHCVYDEFFPHVYVLHALLQCLAFGIGCL